MRNRDVVGEYYIAIYVEDDRMKTSPRYKRRIDAVDFILANNDKWFLGIYTVEREEDGN